MGTRRPENITTLDLPPCTTTNEILAFYLPKLLALFTTKPQFDAPKITQTSHTDIIDIIKA
jgi:hypothetical protein